MSVRAAMEDSSSEALGAAGGGAWMVKLTGIGGSGGGSLEQPRLRALGRQRSRAGVLPRDHFDHAAVRMAAPEAVVEGSESRVVAGAVPAVKGLGE
eukprot:scaffold35239_cov43-Phaeocystis_antarctica.AAC.4